MAAKRRGLRRSCGASSWLGSGRSPRKRLSSSEIRSRVQVLLAARIRRGLRVRAQARTPVSSGERRLAGYSLAMAGPPELSAGPTRIGSNVQTRIAGLQVGAFERDGPAELVAGDRVGRYRIEGKLGAGGMGTVYLAHDPDLDRRVAIKMLHTRVGSGDPSQGSKRLLREAQAMARLAHVNVVAAHDVGVLDGSLFIAMELIDGQDLREWLAECPRSWREIVIAFIEAGRGLLAAHEAGIVHRDFKPENVMVAANGRICVGDFGLAAASSAPQVASQGDLSTSCLSSAGTLTAAGAVMGTPAYMAPEQMVGGEITAAADIFAFCVALYEALYDQRPFEGGSVAALFVAISNGALEPPPRSKV
ncbi:MAG TPA: serine/threonine protein kinase, partial [Nannocystis exedens]|nr:serine/threonine protein kinase [Nannocystis exedens]